MRDTIKKEVFRFRNLKAHFSRCPLDFQDLCKLYS